MKSGNLNFLEPSGPLLACNRTALLFRITKSSWMKWLGHYDTHGKDKKYDALVRKPEV
jgi:hypothetical protein